MSYRVGTGFDIHRLVAGRELVLGGVRIPHSKGLLGHSDGDVIIHAICDAILGALARGDIGQHFPDSSEETLGMNSLEMLKIIIEEVSAEYRIVNIDVNCICEQPKLSAYRNDMTTTIADTCGIVSDMVSVKFRTHEGLGEIGRSEAISAQVVVLVHKHRDQEEE